MKSRARLAVAFAAAAFVPTVASAEFHVGAMPADDQLMFHMHALTGCVGNGGTVYNMLGKFEQNRNEWVVYYQYEDPDGSRYFAYNVLLRQLDTGLWVISCATADGSPAHIVEVLAAPVPPPAEPVAPPPVDPPPGEKPAAPG